ncbi:PTS glucitol/sorbitol transporter subunit IIA [Brachyspira sp. SAP_772]|uniref:PTS glucitol/sorbitol transporter subunit IIA n=1 Tax=Brachyspira sp. SAP_772 TaxID=2608385 RepID=UPI0012F4D98B|nr:PTS glucitol/sorbitol transporter subunit IIA [Brachyspira sp. SAP_772]
MDYNEIIKLKVNYIGENALSFFDEDKLFIIYGKVNDNDLRSYSIIVESEAVENDIEKGMVLSFNDQDFEILEVGCEANNTLKSLTHMTLRFQDFNDPSNSEDILPGSILLNGMPKVFPNIGSYITIKTK